MPSDTIAKLIAAHTVMRAKTLTERLTGKAWVRDAGVAIMLTKEHPNDSHSLLDLTLEEAEATRDYLLELLPLEPQNA